MFKEAMLMTICNTAYCNENMTQKLLSTKQVPNRPSELPQVFMIQDIRDINTLEGLYRVSSNIATDLIPKKSMIGQLINFKLDLSASNTIDVKEALPTQPTTPQVKQEDNLKVYIVRTGLTPTLRLVNTSKTISINITPSAGNFTTNAEFKLKSVTIGISQSNIKSIPNLSLKRVIE